LVAECELSSARSRAEACRRLSRGAYVCAAGRPQRSDSTTRRGYRSVLSIYNFWEFLATQSVQSFASRDCGVFAQVVARPLCGVRSNALEVSISSSGKVPSCSQLSLTVPPREGTLKASWRLRLFRMCLSVCCATKKYEPAYERTRPSCGWVRLVHLHKPCQLCVPFQRYQRRDVVLFLVPR